MTTAMRTSFHNLIWKSYTTITTQMANMWPIVDYMCIKPHKQSNVEKEGCLVFLVTTNRLKPKSKGIEQLFLLSTSILFSRRL